MGGMLPALLQGLVAGIAAGLVFFGAVRVELRWLRRDVDRAHSRLNEHDKRLRTVELRRVQ